MPQAHLHPDTPHDHPSICVQNSLHAFYKVPHVLLLHVAVVHTSTMAGMNASDSSNHPHKACTKSNSLRTEPLRQSSDYQHLESALGFATKAQHVRNKTCCQIKQTRMSAYTESGAIFKNTAHGFRWAATHIVAAGFH